mgnify:CR=1 FL=1
MKPCTGCGKPIIDTETLCERCDRAYREAIMTQEPRRCDCGHKVQAHLDDDTEDNQ